MADADKDIRAAETLQFSSIHVDEALANKEVGSLSYSQIAQTYPFGE